MLKEWQSNNRSISLSVTVKCKGKKRFVVFAKEKGVSNSKYANREIDVDGERNITLSFPVTPQKMFIGIADLNNLSGNDFKVIINEVPLKKYNIWMDAETNDFLSLCVHFCRVCGYKEASVDGRLYKTSDDKFNIKYYPVIVDYLTKKIINTPARIGHQTGTIEVAKRNFDTYTFPQRMIILLHEFSHKYRNPKLGLEINNEIGADINALYIYLGMGFSKVEALYVFANVFLRAQTQGNIERMRKIVDYINRFENGEFAQVA